MRGRCRADSEPAALPACAVCPFPTVRWAVRSLLALKLSVLARRYAFNGFEFAQKVRNIIIADLQHQVADGAVGMNKQTLEFIMAQIRNVLHESKPCRFLYKNGNLGPGA